MRTRILISFGAVAPFVRVCSLFYLRQGFKIINRRLYDHQFLYIYNGKGCVKVDGKTYDVKKGDLFFWVPMEEHSFISDDKSPMTIITLRFDFTQNHTSRRLPCQPLDGEHFDTEEITELIKFSDFEGFRNHLSISSCEGIEEILFEMEKELKMKRLYFQSIVNSLFIKFLFTIARLTVFEQGERLNKGTETLENLLVYLHRYFAKELSNMKLALLFNYNHNYLNRLIKKHTGVSIHAYIINLRLSRAEELLNTTGMSVREVAKEVGYNDVNYFSRLFKQKTGISPSKRNF